MGLQRLEWLGVILCLSSCYNCIVCLRFEKHPDANLHIDQMIVKYGYPVEDHYVATEDGYILHLYRIPHGRNSMHVNKNPVLVMHGLLGCAENFVVAGPRSALAYKLADRGYDVWLGNARGNMHSRNHTTLNPDQQRQFWMFSWHEIGYYDLPAKIDYILNETNQTKLHYIGHSQGGTTLFVMLSEKPEYNKKLKLVTLLAPSVLNKYFAHPLVRPLIPVRNYFINLSEKLQIYEIFPFNRLILEIFKTYCSEATVFREICVRVLMIVGGANPPQINRKLVPVIVGTVPAGASARQVFHFTQNIARGTFRQYDYGRRRNLQKYKRPVPPSYALHNATAPIAIYYGRNDFLTSAKDIELLGKILPNVQLHPVKDKKFSHLDFLWAKDVVKLLYVNVLDLMEKYDRA